MNQPENTSGQNPKDLRQKAAEYDENGRKLKMEIDFARENRYIVDGFSFVSGFAALTAFETMERPTTAIALGVIAVGGVVVSRFQKASNRERYTRFQTIAADTVELHIESGLTPPQWAASVVTPPQGRLEPPEPLHVPDYVPYNMVDLRPKIIEHRPHAQ